MSFALYHQRGELEVEMDSQEREVALLRQELRRMKRYLIALTVTLLLAPLLLAARPGVFDEIKTEKLTIVEPSGVARVVIANSERFPPPRLGGKTYPRKVSPAGLVFYDAKGDEMGGLALTDTGEHRIGALAFDYPNFDAVGLRTVQSEGLSLTGLVINSRPPAGLDVLEASQVVHQRVEIHNRNENAEVLLSDQEGRNRLRLSVDESGEPSIELLDAQGKVTHRIPEQRD